MLVKLLYVTVNYTGQYDDEIASSITDTEWDEISEADYSTLYNAVRTHKSKFNNEKLIVLRKPEPGEVSVKLIASEYLKKVKQEQLKQEESNRKFKEKQELAKQKREIARLKKLKEIYGDVT